MRLPEIDIDDDGDITIEWDLDRRRILTILIGVDYIYYSLLDGEYSFHDELELPREVVNFIDKYLIHDE